MLRNDRKWKYIFMFPEINSAQGLNVFNCTVDASLGLIVEEQVACWSCFSSGISRHCKPHHPLEESNSSMTNMKLWIIKIKHAMTLQLTRTFGLFFCIKRWEIFHRIFPLRLFDWYRITKAAVDHSGWQIPPSTLLSPLFSNLISLIHISGIKSPPYDTLLQL